jgi:hypothetical protein
MVESPTNRTLGFCCGKIVVVVVVESTLESTTVDEVVVEVSLESAGVSAREIDDPMLIANAALNKPAMNRVVNFFITPPHVLPENPR